MVVVVVAAVVVCVPVAGSNSIGIKRTHTRTHIQIMRGSKKVLSEGVQLFLPFFKLMRGERIQLPLKAGHHRPASKTQFKRRFAGGPMVAQNEYWICGFVIFQGIFTSIAKKPYIFVIYQGGMDPGPPPL